jgi:hypothetical protein
MWIVKPARVRVALLGVLIVVLAVLVTACGGSSTSTTAPPTTSGAPTTTSAASPTTGVKATVNLTGDEATIAANFIKFFDGTKPAPDKVTLLENGQQYTKELEAQAASPMGKMASVVVDAVTITSATTADVKYTILVGGTPALPNQAGKAVLQDGVWKVSADTFLALLALQSGTTPSS